MQVFPFLRPAILVCGVTMTLGGCVAAVPLAHLATASATSSAAQPCVQTTGCANAVANLSFTDMAKQFNATVQSWTGTGTNQPPAPAAQPSAASANPPPK